VKDIVIMDACALIAYIRDEKGADVVADLIDSATEGKINLVVN